MRYIKSACARQSQDNLLGLKFTRLLDLITKTIARTDFSWKILSRIALICANIVAYKYYHPIKIYRTLYSLFYCILMILLQSSISLSYCFLKINFLILEFCFIIVDSEISNVYSQYLSCIFPATHFYKYLFVQLLTNILDIVVPSVKNDFFYLH